MATSKADHYHELHFTVKDRYVGFQYIPASRPNYSEPWNRFPNYLYVCPRCGDVWARAVLQPSGDYYPKTDPGWWDVKREPCLLHGSGYLLSSNDFARFPNSTLISNTLLKYEFLRSFHYER